MTGKPGELSLDFMAHAANCSIGWGVQLSTTPDFTGASFIPAYACDDFSKQEPGLTLAVRVLLTPLTRGATYYYVCGSEALRAPWSQVFSFTYDTGSQRAGGPVYAILADFGFYNAESLMKLSAEAYEGRFDALLHAGDFAYAPARPRHFLAPVQRNPRKPRGGRQLYALQDAVCFHRGECGRARGELHQHVLLAG